METSSTKNFDFCICFSGFFFNESLLLKILSPVSRSLFGWLSVVSLRFQSVFIRLFSVSILSFGAILKMVYYKRWEWRVRGVLFQRFQVSFFFSFLHTTRLCLSCLLSFAAANAM